MSHLQLGPDPDQSEKVLKFQTGYGPWPGQTDDPNHTPSHTPNASKLKPNWMSHTRNMSRYVPKQQKLVITCNQMPPISWNISHGIKVPHAPYGPWVSFGTCHRWTLLHCTVIPPMLRSEENRLRSGKNNPTCETCEVKGRQCRSISSSSHGSLKRTAV